MLLRCATGSMMLSWQLYSSAPPETCVHHPESIQVAHPSSCIVMHHLCGMLILGSVVLWQSYSKSVSGLWDVKSLLIHRWVRVSFGTVH